MNIETLQDELATFADLGSDVPRLRQNGRRIRTELHRNGELLRLAFENRGDGKVEVRRRDERIVRPSYRMLLASDFFADLAKWIDHQRRLLAPTKAQYAIPIVGTLSDGDEVDVGGFDDFLARPRAEGGLVRAVLIDGPAGIGKTKFIERLALERAEGYRRTRRPLILHVQSRGRVLTYLQDLIATSLQILRLGVTFDQVPILVRHGLVTIAIDGFDELGDPNGYDLAWNQVNDLVREIRGEGTLILAGRDTFIGRERITSHIVALDSGDEIDALALQLPRPAVARDYLRTQKHWPDEEEFRELMTVLLEPDSYALRPFFLSRLDVDAVQPMLNVAGGNPLAYLIDMMVEREATKFGDVVDAAISTEAREGFVRGFLREVARTMADDQTDAILDTVLLWIVDVVGGNLTEDDEVLRILKNRAIALAFLENDDDRRYRRFPSSQIANHFLADETVDLITDGEIPKYVRRNIFGADFLSAFSDLVMHRSATSPDRVQVFFRKACGVAQSTAAGDRAPRNMGSLVLATLPALGDQGIWSLENVSVDEALIEETVPPTSIRNVTVNQLDLRGANAADMQFEDCSIQTLIVDAATRVSPSFPTPAMIRREGSAGSGTVTDPGVIRDWMRGHGGAGHGHASAPGGFQARCGEHEFVKVLERSCRTRSFWIPIAGDDASSRFARSVTWPAVMQFLEGENRGRRVVKGVGGRQKHFFRIMNRREVLELLWGPEGDPKVKAFHRALDKVVAEL